MTIFWFRRDLRLEDNVGLFHSLVENENILPIFIFDKNILSQLEVNDARVSFIHQLLSKIQKKLQHQGKSLAVFFDTPLSVFQKLISENKIDSVYTNHDYEPYARKRDKEINDFLKSVNVAFKTCKDQVIFEKKEITKEDGSPYVVYTPYSKKWIEKFKETPIKYYNSEDYIEKIVSHNYPFLTLKDIGFSQSKIIVPDFKIDTDLLENYSKKRNFPYIKNGTSLIAPHLRFGSISIRQIVFKAAQTSEITFLKELIWREFFKQILWHFPHTTNKSFKEKYDGIKWENNELNFQKWRDGNTGYPFVDAGMRELNATGHMHNRVRMIVASFLCKHLLIDWRWGEAYFANKLLDYEQSSNVGNWQWAAGSGVDAAPYFRIFNPTEQIKKFDPDLKYIKKWIPELETKSYPNPMVDHKEAREKCLKVFKEALS